MSGKQTFFSTTDIFKDYLILVLCVLPYQCVSDVMSDTCALPVLTH